MTGRKDKAAPLRRITLTIDTSDVSANALDFVLSNFQPDRSTEGGGRAPFHVSVLHVIKRQPLAPIAVRFTAPWIKSEQKMKNAARRLVNGTVEQLLKAGFTAEPIYKIGDPAEEIMKVAAKQHTDMIVMGAKGLSAIDRILLGSVSTRVVQYANCPVLVVR